MKWPFSASRETTTISSLARGERPRGKRRLGGLLPSAPPEPHANEELAEIARPFDKASLLGAALMHERITWSMCELLTVVLANSDSGTETSIPPDTLNTLLWALNAELAKAPPGSPTGTDLQLRVRQSRGFHPPWYSAPLFAEVLRPFNDELRSLVGYSVDEVFEAAAAWTENEAPYIPPAIQPFYDDIVIGLTDATTFSKMWDIVVVDVAGKGYVLTMKAAEVLYRLICERLDAIPTFGGRKGASLEAFTRRRIEAMMPGWRWIPNYHMGEFEKDLLGIGKTNGLAVECKGFRFRRSSNAWSRLNAMSDAKPVVEALTQIAEPMVLLREGGKIDDPNIRIAKRPSVQGIVVTDNVLTPYVRGCVDNWRQDEPDREWHGTDVWLASMIDLDFLVKSTRRMTILLDYLRRIRARANIRYNQEPQTWQLYTTQIAVDFANPAFPNVLINGFDWKAVQESQFGNMFPAWVSREEMIAKARARGSDEPRTADP